MTSKDVLEKLYNSALAHLARGRVELARPLLAELQRVLPGNDSVHMLASILAVVDFEWPAQRSEIALAPRPAPRQEDIDLVSFHVSIDASNTRSASGIHAPSDYRAVLDASFESAKIRAPAARRILITDEHTAIPDSIPAQEVVRFPIDREHLMFERMRVQEIYLRGRAPGRYSVLMDSDIVVNADPAPIFAEDFDVGLTWRAGYPDAPFNGGVIFAAAQAQAFFARALECYRAIAGEARVAGMFRRDLRSWWGDQFALAALVGFRAYGERRSDALSVDGVRVRFFPCSEYNFTFEPGREYPRDELRRKFFLHFKGNRKAAQGPYLELMRTGRL